MKKFLKGILDDFLALPFLFVIIFISLFTAAYYEFIEIAFWVLLYGGLLVWFLYKKFK